MDQVKVIMAVLKKQYFWVLCGLLLITSTVVWMLAVGSIQDQTQAHLDKINATMAEAQGVSQIRQHPNDAITKAYNERTAILRQQVFQVWDDLYKKQRESVLKWPQPLGEQFIEFIQSVPFGDPIHVDLRETYQNYVKTRWDELPAIIKAKPKEKEKSRPGAETEVRQAVPDWIVIWKDQEDIRRHLFSQPNPTDEWVWATQEDLWIYENLLNIIKLTNEGALGPHNAVISTIAHMEVGQEAASGAGGTEQRISSGSEGAGVGDEEASSSGGGGGGGLLSNRYIDAAGVPIADGLSVLKDEYKQVPVRLELRMDPREIPQLIVNCANADLPVEIQQVRMNVNSGGRGKRVEAPVLSKEDRKAGRKVPHVEVSMQGVIYIFNPPNTKKLNINENASSSGISATEALGGQESGEASPKDAASLFEEAPADGTAPAESPTEGTPMPATEPGASPAGAEPMAETAPATEVPAAPTGAEQLPTEPVSPAAAPETVPPDSVPPDSVPPDSVVPDSTESDSAESDSTESDNTAVPAEDAAPKVTPNSLEDLFED